MGANIGLIRWFSKTARFEATCTRDADHIAARCRLTRGSIASAAKGVIFNPAAGRPLGLLAAWLLEPFESLAREHCNVLYVTGFAQQMRINGRQHLLTLPNDDLLAAFERLRRAGEPEEPETDP